MEFCASLKFNILTPGLQQHSLLRTRRIASTTMALCCIGGVCIPYSALVPLLLYGIKWLVEKLVAAQILPKALQERLLAWTSPAPKSCCSSGGSQDVSSSANGGSTNTSTASTEKTHAAEKSSLVTTIDSEEAWNSLVHSHHLLVAKFTAKWCVPCQAIQPVYASLAQEMGTKAAIFCQVDVDDLDQVAAEYGVALLPTFVVISGGQELDRYRGSQEAKLRELIQRHVG